MTHDTASDWETWFWEVFAASRNAMTILDGDRRIVSANGAMQRLLASTEDDIVGRRIEDFLEVDDAVTVEDRWQAMLARGGGHATVGIRDRQIVVSSAAHVAHVGGRLAVL